MCGIGGIINLNGEKIPNLQKRSELMLNDLEHRGPDGKGYWINSKQNVMICNTRLAIVDPLTDIKVPLFLDKKVLSFNGEIYDYIEQKKRLSRLGCRLISQCDSEVLIHGLSLEGEEFLGKIDGMWSLAFYDEEKKSLLLSRDLLGERQLFYTQINNLFIFASEMNCLLTQISENIEYDFSSIISAFQFRSCQPGKTLINGVKKLLPGYNIKITDGCIKIYRHLKYELNSWLDKIGKVKSFEKLIDVYDEEFSSAVKSRVPKDLEFVSTLSGGIDSTLLNVYLSKNSKKPKFCLHGISNNTKDGKDELSMSSYTSNKLNFELKKFDMHNDSIVEIYQQQCANSFDGIFCEGSIGFRQLSKFVKGNNIKILLLSDGVDEFFSGYMSDIDNYYSLNNKIFRNFDFIKSYLKGPLVSNILSKFRRNDILNWAYASDKKFSFRPINGGTNIYDMMQIFFKQDLFNMDYIFGSIHKDYNNLLTKLDFSQKTALAYALNITPDYFNLRADRASYFHSTEFRLPFQKKSIVEMMLATPAPYRFKNNQIGKLVLRKLVERYVGKNVAWKKKIGFYFPAWWDNEFKKKLKMKEIINDSKIFDLEIFKKKSKDKILKNTDSRFFWFSYCLALTDLKIKSKNFNISYVPI